jgi:hypothetical protein
MLVEAWLFRPGNPTAQHRTPNCARRLRASRPAINPARPHEFSARPTCSRDRRSPAHVEHIPWGDTHYGNPIHKIGWPGFDEGISCRPGSTRLRPSPLLLLIRACPRICRTQEAGRSRLQIAAPCLGKRHERDLRSAAGRARTEVCRSALRSRPPRTPGVRLALRQPDRQSRSTSRDASRHSLSPAFGQRAECPGRFPAAGAARRDHQIVGDVAHQLAGFFPQLLQSSRAAMPWPPAENGAHAPARRCLGIPCWDSHREYLQCEFSRSSIPY